MFDTVSFCMKNSNITFDNLCKINIISGVYKTSALAEIFRITGPKSISITPTDYLFTHNSSKRQKYIQDVVAKTSNNYILIDDIDIYDTNIDIFENLHENTQVFCVARTNEFILKVAQKYNISHYTLRLYGEELRYRYMSQEEIIRAIDRGVDLTR